MQLIRGLSSPLFPLPTSVMCMGCFDGLHLGHQALISRTVQVARARNVPSVCLTFSPCPKGYFAKKRNLPLKSGLMGFRDKWQKCVDLGVDYLLILPFNDTLSALSAMEFVRCVCIQSCQIQHWVMGPDCGFGHGREGSATWLSQHRDELPFTWEIIASVYNGDLRVSTSLIRQDLQAGHMINAARRLGQTFYMTGRVIKGAGVGRKLGARTMNFVVPTHPFVLNGVYAVWVEDAHGQGYPAIAHVGSKPTFGVERELVEVHLLDCDIIAYGYQYRISFQKFIRGIVKFDSVDQLKMQIQRDICVAKQYHEKCAKGGN